MEKQKYANFRAHKEDLEVLKEIAAIHRESMLQTFKRLVQQEYERVQKDGGHTNAALQKNQDRSE